MIFNPLWNTWMFYQIQFTLYLYKRNWSFNQHSNQWYACLFLTHVYNYSVYLLLSTSNDVFSQLLKNSLKFEAERCRSKWSMSQCSTCVSCMTDFIIRILRSDTISFHLGILVEFYILASSLHSHIVILPIFTQIDLIEKWEFSK